MKKNKSFARHSIIIIIFGIFMMYAFSCIATDQMNVLTPYFSALGWGDLTITNPVTIGGFICVVFTVFIGVLMVKFGAKSVSAISFIIVAIALLGIGIAGKAESTALYTISLLIARIFVQPLQMGAMLLCADWFVKFRGTAMGIVTIGSPINTATSVSLLSLGVSVIGFTKTYMIFAAIILIIGVLTLIFVKSKPEDCNLYPDGADERPDLQKEEIKMTFKEVFRRIDSWLLVISFGIMWLVVTAMLSYYVVRMQEVGVDSGIYLTCLSIGAIGGIPMSILIGIVDDKAGTIKANYCLIATYMLALIPFLLMKADSIGLLILAVFGIAGTTGAMNNMIASTTTYVFGSKNYMAANKWIFALQCLLGTCGTMFMAAMRSITGKLDLAYGVMIILIVVATVCIAIIGRKPDYDRGVIQKAEKR